VAAPAPYGIVTYFAALYLQQGGQRTLSGQAYSTDRTDTSAVVVIGAGALAMEGVTVRTGGSSTSTDASFLYGLDAAVLALSGSTIRMTGGSISTKGSGASGAFANGDGSLVALEGLAVDCAGPYARAAMAARGGKLRLRDVVLRAAGEDGAAVATGMGGGTVDMEGGSLLADGLGSPGIVSMGDVYVDGAKVRATRAEAVVIDGAGSVALRGTDLSSARDGRWGVLIHRSTSDGTEAEGRFSMTGGSLRLEAADGPLFRVANASADISLSGVGLSVGSGTLLRAAAGTWGRSGANGGSAVVHASGQSLRGDFTADGLSALSLTLIEGSSLEGAVNPDGKARAAGLVLGADSSWKVGADSWLTTLGLSDGKAGLSRIEGGGHAVRYRAASNPWLEGRSYGLAGGGTLSPY